MKKYIVSIPIAGRLIFEVEAKDKQAAINAAWGDYDAFGQDNAVDIEWEALECITNGNCTNAPYNNVQAAEVKNGT